MNSVLSWLLAAFMVMFWGFRLIVAFMAQYDNSFGGFFAFNYTIEIILLFLTVLCFLLYLRRNIFGGIIYLLSYGFYFGSYILQNVFNGEMTMIVTQNVLVAAVGIILAISIFFDLFVSVVRKRDPKDKKVDWFFKNEKYDREFDERRDKNEYRNY